MVQTFAFLISVAQKRLRDIRAIRDAWRFPREVSTDRCSAIARGPGLPRRIARSQYTMGG